MQLNSIIFQPVCIMSLLLVSIGLLLYLEITCRREVRKLIEKISRFETRSIPGQTGAGGYMPICTWCKRIRDNENQWHVLEVYLTRELGLEFTHGVCPECARLQYSII